MSCPESSTFSLPTPTLGEGVYSACYTSPISWALGNTNPYDITNWAYIHKTDETLVENLEIETGNPSGGDIYLGVIAKVCDGSPSHPQSKYDNIPYTLVMLDADENTCVSGYGYGQSCWKPGEYSHWYMRNWEDTMNYWDGENGGTGDDGEVFCCTYSCNGSSDVPSRTVKCPQTYWPGSPMCTKVMNDFCSPDTWTSQDESTGYCDTYMNSDDVCSINKNQVFTNAVSQWVQGLGGDSPDEDDPFLPKVIEYASQTPGVYDNFLSQVCSTLKMSDLENNPNLSKLCGCFLPDEEYLLPGIIPVECQIACSINQQVGGINRGEWNAITQEYDTLTCNQSTCVMDNTTVNLINSNYGNSGIQLDQLCAGCSSSSDGGGGSSCTCLINGTTINSINSTIKGGITLDQMCSGGCSTFNNSSSTTGTNVDCKSGNPIIYGSGIGGGCDSDVIQEGLNQIEGDISSNYHIYIILGILGVIIIIFFIWWAIIKSRNDTLKKSLIQ